MHVGVSTCMFIHTPLRACVCVCGCVCARTRVHSQALPCEIRLICQWCRSSFMINSPASWKQCFCALASCGTDVNCTRVWASARLTAGLPTLTSCSGCVDVVTVVEHESTACHKSCVLCTVFASRLLAACVWWCELNTCDLICDISQRQIPGVSRCEMQNATFTGHLRRWAPLHDRENPITGRNHITVISKPAL